MGPVLVRGPSLTVAEFNVAEIRTLSHGLVQHFVKSNFDWIQFTVSRGELD
jgi:hypothetical protein